MAREGFLEKFNIKSIAGWVPAKTKGDKVRIELNGQLIATIDADIERQDLQHRGYGFEFNCPADLTNTGNVIVRVYYDNDKEVANSPKQIITDSSELQKVLYGKDGWLFLNNDTNSSLGYLTGHQPANENTLALWVELVLQRITACNEWGMKYYHLVVPEKEVVYRDYLPEGLTISAGRPAVRLLQALNEISVQNVVYPDYLEQADNRSDQLFYYKGDTHWTHAGAYFAVEKLFQLIAEDYEAIQLPSKNAYKFKPGYQAGDLLIKTTSVNIESIMYTTSISQKIRKTYNNKINNTGRRMEFINPEAPKLRLMCWHTSSVDWMTPFLNDMFGSACYIWDQSINWNEVLRYRPDILLFQSNERFLTRVPGDIDLELS